MENNIYIPGDLVMYKENIRIIKEPRDKNHFDLREPETNLRVCYVPIDEMSEVELTSEILEKNGYKRVINHDFIYQHKENDCYELWENTKNWSMYWRGVKLFDFRYIHELQHLFFGLGVDFKIEV